MQQVSLQLSLKPVELFSQLLRIGHDAIDRVGHEAGHVDQCGQLFDDFAMGLVHHAPPPAWLRKWCVGPRSGVAASVVKSLLVTALSQERARVSIAMSRWSSVTPPWPV